MADVERRQPSWTIDEACEFLDPPITRRQLSNLVSLLGVRATGLAPSTGGRRANLYDVAEVMRLHAGVAEWLSQDRS